LSENENPANLSKEEILALMEKKYIEQGYLYSGSMPTNATYFYYNKDNLERLWELVREKRLVLRACEGSSVELPLDKRHELIQRFNLAKEWEKGSGTVFYPNGPYGEVTLVLREHSHLKAE